jgi:hypothetical protein
MEKCVPQNGHPSSNLDAIVALPQFGQLTATSLLPSRSTIVA